MIIFEGPDNSGKSYNAKVIATDCNLPYIRSPGPGFGWDWVKSQVTKPYKRVHDRFPLISEKVYGPVLRDEERISTEKGEYWLNEMSTTLHLVVYCRPPREVIKDFDVDREEMDGVKANIDQFIDRYDEWVHYLKSEKNWLIIEFDYTSDEIDKIKRRIDSIW